jgi:hypothetical protein
MLVMLDFTQKLYDELLLKLADLDQKDYRENLADPRLSQICTSIDLIRNKLKSYQFTAENDEIHYFKSVLPPVLSLLIYYTDKIEWDRILQQNSTDAIQEFYERTFTNIKNFRRDNKEFFDYCRNGKTMMDKFYFLRNSPMNMETIHQIESLRDPSCPTVHCVIVATFLAQLKQEQNMYMAMTMRKNGSSSSEKESKGLKWTGKIIDLIELGSALHENKAFDNGNVSQREMFEYLGKVFQVDTGNIYRQFQDLRIRKTGYTKYLDLIAQQLRKRIDDMDD